MKFQLFAFFLGILILSACSDTEGPGFEPFEDHLSADIEALMDKNKEQAGLQRLQKAMQAYRAKEYKEATKLFEQHFRANPLMLDGSKIKLYMGIAQFGNEQYTKAELSFETLAHRKDYLFVDAANWYLALTEIKLGKKEEAKKHLGRLSSSKLFSEKAATLLKQLK